MSEKDLPPEIVLGTMTFGNQVNEKTAERMVGMFLGAGHTRLDTAYRYNDGKTEEMLGRILKGLSRDKFVIDSKAHPGEGGGLHPRQLERQLHLSLERLQTDCIDLFYLHAPDSQTPVAATLEACEKLHRQGKFRNLGLSNYPAWQVADIRHLCQTNGWISPTVYQGMYNAITRGIEPELVPSIRYFGLGFYAYNPLAGGLLTGKYERPDRLPDTGRFALLEFYQDRFWNDLYFDALAQVRDAAGRCGVSMAEAALRWLCYHSPLDAGKGDGIILGASSPEQLDSNLNACRNGAIPEELVAAFDEAWRIAQPRCPRYFRT